MSTKDGGVTAKRGAGRPALARPRKSLLTLAVTAEEREQIEAAADGAGVTVSTWLRDAAVERLPDPEVMGDAHGRSTGAARWRS